MVKDSKGNALNETTSELDNGYVICKDIIREYRHDVIKRDRDKEIYYSNYLEIEDNSAIAYINFFSKYFSNVNVLKKKVMHKERM